MKSYFGYWFDISMKEHHNIDHHSLPDVEDRFIFVGCVFRIVVSESRIGDPQYQRSMMENLHGLPTNTFHSFHSYSTVAYAERRRESHNLTKVNLVQR